MSSTKYSSKAMPPVKTMASILPSSTGASEPISLAMQLIDSRQEPTPLDLMMMDWLEYYEVPYVLVLTKADKLPFSKLGKTIEGYKERFQSQLTEGSCHGIVPFSIVSGDGKQDLLKVVLDHLKSAPLSKKEAV